MVKDPNLLVFFDVDYTLFANMFNVNGEMLSAVPSGTKGKRMALPHSRVLIHQPLGGAQGQATDIEIQAAEIIRIKKSLNEILASNTGQSLKKIEKDTDRDYIMTPQEALEYGMIDKVISRDIVK